MRIACTATNMFGRFDRDMVPNAPRRVPTLDEMRAGYGAQLPSFEVMARYTPGIMKIHEVYQRTWKDST